MFQGILVGPLRIRFAALQPRLVLELYERDPTRETLEKIDPRSAGNLNTWLVPHHDSEVLLVHARSALEPIVACAPKPTTVHPNAQTREV